MSQNDYWWHFYKHLVCLNSPLQTQRILKSNQQPMDVTKSYIFCFYFPVIVTWTISR